MGFNPFKPLEELGESVVNSAGNLFGTTALVIGGAALGFALGGPLGALTGAQIGAPHGSLAFPESPPENPQSRHRP